MTGEDYEAAKDEHRRDWPGYQQGARDALDAILAVVQMAGGCPELDEAERRVRALVGGA